MGIMAPIARYILQVHKKMPLTGQGLFVGRQTVPLSLKQAKSLIQSEGLQVREITPIYDVQTRSGISKDYITEETFFNLFCDLKITYLDVSAYEKANIVHDMQDPIPNDLKNKFDFIWNGSCLDNIFDPAAALRNSCDFLKPGGRILTMEIANSHFGPYVSMSHTWFYDFYLNNDFKDIEILSLVYKRYNIWRGPYKVYKCMDYSAARNEFALARRKNPVMTLGIATKGQIDQYLNPIQFQYSQDLNDDKLRYNFKNYLINTRSSNKFSINVDGWMQMSALKGIKSTISINDLLTYSFLWNYSTRYLVNLLKFIKIYFLKFFRD
jgi:SAM-dependent methyltransferase